ncbi:MULTISPECIES: hypothetical protein [unclassified Sulfitobacter]|uniref:hypothetical protein n=1 Tax=unclassified Sulfitobacter TaxID=196795 RepID=UPI0007C230A0|nr:MULTISPECIES: hypothetical protein [unclassified Sulfitobacter]KZY05248.1 hypothetical protein A3721_15055 [Sulfitobacter sp. HI0023]KZY25596.1 hypothetical protein A3728_18480 [Sulfitobacter sp. HI0040]KZZ68854.1 hypothetical protein A3764_12150 [Sulfitobacter sp. HI0129]
MTTPELTAAERIRVYAASGGGAHFDNQTLYHIATEIEQAEEALARAKELHACVERAINQAKRRMAVIACATSVAALTMIAWGLS